MPYLKLTRVSDFLGNQDAVATLRTFLNASSSLNSLLVIGPSGGGKTTLVNLLLNESPDAYCVLRPNYEEFTTHKDLASTVDKFLYMKNMHEIFFKKLKILFLDDLDILLTTDRYSNTYVQDIIAKLKKAAGTAPPFKILMTCSQGNEKRMTDIKKKCLYCHMKNPDPSTLCDRLLPDLGIDHDSLASFRPKLLDLAKAYGGNVRCVLTNLSTMLAEWCSNNTSAKSNSDRRDIQVSSVVFDKNILDICDGIIKATPWTVKDLEIWLSVDPCLVSYIIYDNVMGQIVSNNHRHMSRVLRAYSQASIMENVLHNKNDQIICDSCNIWRCGLIKIAIHDVETSPSSKSTKTPPLKCNEPLKYTTIPTRSANFYAAQKKNRVASASMFCPRETFLSLASLGIIEDSSINQRNRALL